MMNKKLIFGIIALVAFVVVMLLVFSREKDVYEKPVQDIFAEGMADSLQLKPAELGNLLATGNFLLVDIRKPEYFINESIEGAVNIPAGELLTEENQGRLEEAVESGKRIVLMGANTHETLLPWLLVRQTGVENVYLLLGGFEGWKNFHTNPSFTPSSLEISASDYSAEIEKLKAGAGVQTQEEKPKEKPKITPKPVVHHGAAEGGC
ncbi:MAG: rhodanese-like domain-containing protein [Bacteroidales bacterium]|jgi:rhodanese-related sulfurtransferase|nr:rhodanese-like domain-containing protein [Bacteroidales bacterium]NPV36261.1 rhodanese-like domain-containing protein [Bacteroidales bacterium]